MSTTVPTNEFLVKSAKKQLGFKPTAQDATVPREYLEELKKLLEAYPDEVNFTLQREPRLGYGYITCLREGCNERIVPLESGKDANAKDGGITRGFGAFTAYQWHIRIAHPIKPKEEYPLPSIKTEPKPLTIKAEPKPKPLAIKAEPRPLLIKPEPVGDRVPNRKRSGTFSGFLELAPKKIKADPENPSIPEVDVKRSPAISTEAIRGELLDLQTEINHIQPQLDRSRRKDGKSTTQLKREMKITSQLIALHQRRKELTEMLPAVSAPAHPIAGPSFQNGATDWFAQPRQPLAFVQPSLTSVTVASGSDLLVNPLRDELMDTDSDGDDPTPPPTSDVDPFRSFEDDDKNRMLVDDTNLGVDSHHYNTAKADDIKRYLEIAGNSDYFDGDAKVEASLKALGLPNLSTLLPGMEVALMPHQVIGVDWMLKQERCATRRGGVLADEMGLGKTVQAIAVMVANRSTDDQRCQVLILAPLALLDQWQLEIEMKTSCGLKCYVHHGQTRAKKASDLAEYDVIITTHATLVSEWHNANFEEIWAKKKTNAYRRKNRSAGFIVDDEDGDTALKKAIKKKKNKSTGVLYEIQWHRVIVDEAHQIRNKLTRVSNAVVDLDATYRWCLTGTPIINTLSDAYGLIRFLQLRPWNDWNQFNELIGRNEKKRPKLATDRLQSIFKTTLLRRNKDTVLDGKKLITLPPKTVELVKLEFCIEEREIYKAVESKSQQIFNRFLRAGTVLKHYHYVLVLLLRLRQICNHPALITERGEDLEAAGRTWAEAEVERAIKSFGAGFASKVKGKIRDLETERMEAELTQSGDDGQGGQVEECPICFDVLSDGVVTGCCHIFCRECITGILNNPPSNNTQNMNEDERPCPSCRQPISSSKLFTLEAFNSPKGKRRASARPFEFATDSMDVDESESSSDDDFIVPDDEDDYKPRRGKKRAKRNVVLSDDEYDDVIIPAAKPEAKPKASVGEMNEDEISTKMQRMMHELIALKKSNPDQKTVVISQWTGYLGMVSRYLTDEGFAHVKYQGSMSRDERGRAVRAFMAKDNATVMLMSLKCGGVGLNLTRANRVISLDMAWSRAVDDQAFDRVHRLGQDRDVFVKRLVIADTVEDRILQMQETKKSLADGSLGEGSGQKMGRLSVKQLANLFGLDHRGNVL